MDEIRSYGRLLGDYFQVVWTIGEMETEFDDAELKRIQIYHRLIRSREDIRARLDEASITQSDSDVKATLDEAFSNL